MGGWVDLTNRCQSLVIRGLRVDFSGVDDPHLGLERYAGWPPRHQGPGQPDRTCGSPSSMPRTSASWTTSPRTAPTCCWPGTPTAARSGAKDRGPRRQLRPPDLACQGPARLGKQGTHDAGERVRRHRHLGASRRSGSPASPRPCCSRSPRVPEPARSPATTGHALPWGSTRGTSWALCPLPAPGTGHAPAARTGPPRDMPSPLGSTNGHSGPMSTAPRPGLDMPPRREPGHHGTCPPRGSASGHSGPMSIARGQDWACPAGGGPPGGHCGM